MKKEIRQALTLMLMGGYGFWFAFIVPMFFDSLFASVFFIFPLLLMSFGCFFQGSYGLLKILYQRFVR